MLSAFPNVFPGLLVYTANVLRLRYNFERSDHPNNINMAEGFFWKRPSDGSDHDSSEEQSSESEGSFSAPGSRQESPQRPATSASQPEFGPAGDASPRPFKDVAEQSQPR